MKLTKLVKLKVGSPQFRIKEANDSQASTYKFYGQVELMNDLTDIDNKEQETKQIRTLDQVATLKEGDVVFSLISGTASLVRKIHSGYLYTQNYIVLEVNDEIDKSYLIYLLNENKSIARQFRIGLQGSTVLKYTVKQLRELKLPEIPKFKKQQIIGQIYLKQLKLQALRERVASNETLLRLSRIEDATNHERN